MPRLAVRSSDEPAALYAALELRPTEISSSPMLWAKVAVTGFPPLPSSAAEAA